ncbi:MAG: Tripartite-type tricarboxylate transporter, receptor component TctC [Hyphomicrobiales bacterium]|nr:Tripartite-type tricarboxylate transporter, receptor component TctC [Hyphomicrobiales bacterium]
MFFRIHLSALALLACAGAACADPIEDFYKGKQINFIIGVGEGGGYDLSSRLAAQHLSRFIPGNPTIVPRNMPAAGSIAAAEYVYNVAPKDGTTLAMFQPTYITEKINDTRRKYDFEKFTYIGRVDSSVLVGLAWHASPVQSVEDAKKTEVPLAAVAAAGTSATMPWALNRILGTKYKVVLGYPSSAAMGLALERGEAQGIGSTSWDYVLTKREWLDEKKVKILYVISLQRFRDLPDVPTVMEIVDSPLDKNAMKLISSTSSVGRAIVAPPENDKARTAALRAAFDKMAKDPEFLADAERRRLGSDTLDGQSLQDLVADVAAQPQEVIDRMKELTSPPK